MDEESIIPSPYQNNAGSTLLNKKGVPQDPPARNDADEDDEEDGSDEKTSLLVGYGSVDKPVDDTVFGMAEAFPSAEATKDRKRGLGRWAMVGVGCILYVVAVSTYNNRQASDNAVSSSMNSQEITNVELLGSSKKTSKEPVFEPVTYPACPGGVELKYIKEPLTFEAHEIAANASGCHLASIHNLEENSKYTKTALWKTAYGPEIGMAFASGKPLTKTFWLGGHYESATMDAWEWTDNSTWDFGLNATDVEGCLSSTTTFIEVGMPVIPPLGHWATAACSTPLPAIYKCCIPTSAPTDSPTDSPTVTLEEEDEIAVGEDIQENLDEAAAIDQDLMDEQGAEVTADSEGDADDDADVAVDEEKTKKKTHLKKTAHKAPKEEPEVVDEADTGDDEDDEPESGVDVDVDESDAVPEEAPRKKTHHKKTTHKAPKEEPEVVDEADTGDDEDDEPESGVDVDVDEADADAVPEEAPRKKTHHKKTTHKAPKEEPEVVDEADTGDDEDDEDEPESDVDEADAIPEEEPEVVDEAVPEEAPKKKTHHKAAVNEDIATDNEDENPTEEAAPESSEDAEEVTPDSVEGEDEAVPEDAEDEASESATEEGADR
jgi:hypothetical protein